MKKILIPLILVGLLALLGGCGKSNQAASEPTPGPTDPAQEQTEREAEIAENAKLSAEDLAKKFLTEIFAVEDLSRYAAAATDLSTTGAARDQALIPWIKQYDTIISDEYTNAFLSSGMPYLFESLGTTKGFTQTVNQITLTKDAADSTKYRYSGSLKVKPKKGGEFETTLEGFVGVAENPAGGFLINDFTLISPFNIAYAKLNK